MQVAINRLKKPQPGRHKPTASIRALARQRLEQLQGKGQSEPDAMRDLRAAGYVLIGDRRGYVILPPEQD